jgi:hypothetical protein
MAEHKEEELVRWRGLVSEQIASGKSVAAFCRDRGLQDWQIYEWKKRLRSVASVPFGAVGTTARRGDKLRVALVEWRVYNYH